MLLSDTLLLSSAPLLIYLEYFSWSSRTVAAAATSIPPFPRWERGATAQATATDLLSVVLPCITGRCVRYTSRTLSVEFSGMRKKRMIERPERLCY